MIHQTVLQELFAFKNVSFGIFGDMVIDRGVLASWVFASTGRGSIVVLWNSL